MSDQHELHIRKIRDRIEEIETSIDKYNNPVNHRGVFTHYDVSIRTIYLSSEQQFLKDLLSDMEKTDNVEIYKGFKITWEYVPSYQGFEYKCGELICHRMEDITKEIDKLIKDKADAEHQLSKLEFA